MVGGRVRVGGVGGGVAHALRGGRGPEEAKIYGAQRAGLGRLPQEKPREKEWLGNRAARLMADKNSSLKSVSVVELPENRGLASPQSAARSDRVSVGY